MTSPESGSADTRKAVPTPPAREAAIAPASGEAPAKAAPPPSPAQTATTTSDDARVGAVGVPMRGSGVDRAASGAPSTARHPRRVWPD